MQILKVQKQHRQSKSEAEAELEKIRRKAERKNRKNPFTVDERQLPVLCLTGRKNSLYRQSEQRGNPVGLQIWKRF